jgi:hypothetical protein
MPTIKKIYKSKSFVNEKESDYEKAKKALKSGGRLVYEISGSGKETFAIEYSKTGGYFKITKTLYNKLKKEIV